MPLAKIEKIYGRAVYIEGDDIDTDRIIPARFMKCLTFDGLGSYAFYDVRFSEEGASKNHPLDRPEHQGASILISGSNFGSGSSREHAPQALYHFGIRAIIAESFAEIFFGNSNTLGMPCVTLSSQEILTLARLIEANPALPLELDLHSRQLSVEDKTFTFELPEGARQNLVEGKWDALGELLESRDDIRQLTQTIPYFHR